MVREGPDGRLCQLPSWGKPPPRPPGYLGRLKRKIWSWLPRPSASCGWRRRARRSAWRTRSGNADATLRFVARAAERGAQVLVLPELGPHRLHLRRPLLQPDDARHGGRARPRAGPARDGRRATVVVVGLPVLQGGRLFNAAAVLQAGRVLGVVPKTFLPGYKEYYEERWFSSAREAARGGGAPGRPAGPLRHGPPVPAARGPRRHPRRRDLRGPLGADPAELAARGGGRHPHPQPLGLERRRGQGRVPPGARPPAVGPHARRLRLRQRGRPRVARPTSSSGGTC